MENYNGYQGKFDVEITKGAFRVPAQILRKMLRRGARDLIEVKDSRIPGTILFYDNVTPLVKGFQLARGLEFDGKNILMPYYFREVNGLVNGELMGCGDHLELWGRGTSRDTSTPDLTNLG